MKYIIEKKKPLSQCSKTHTSTGVPVSDENECSEWIVQYAIQKYNIGDEVTEEQLQKDIFDAKIIDTLNLMVEEGLIEELFDTEKGRNADI